MKETLTGIALAAISTVALAQFVNQASPSHHGFMLVNQYRQLTELQRRAYVEGVIDGLYLAPKMANRDLIPIEHLGECMWTIAATGEKLRYVVDRYVDANFRSDENMHQLVLEAIHRTCSEAGSPLTPIWPYYRGTRSASVY